MLETTVSAVNSALKRARATLAERRDDRARAPRPAEQDLIERFVQAYGSADVDGLVALLTEDIFISMPPLPFEYEGLDAVAGFFAAVFGSGQTSPWLRPAPTASRRSAPTCADRTG